MFVSDKHKCVFCGSDTFVEVPRYSKMLDLPGHVDSRVVRCGKCNGLFLSPYIESKLLSSMYSKTYFTANADDSPVGLNKSENKDGSDSTISEGSGVLGLHVDEGQFFEAASKSRVSKFVESIRELKSLNPASKSILDVGAANGEFLVSAKHEGLEIFGVEFSDYAAGQATKTLGCNIFCGDVSKKPGPSSLIVIT